jgi:hypothetical protein
MVVKIVLKAVYPVTNIVYLGGFSKSEQKFSTTSSAIFSILELSIFLEARKLIFTFPFTKTALKQKTCIQSTGTDFNTLSKKKYSTRKLLSKSCHGINEVDFWVVY